MSRTLELLNKIRHADWSSHEYLVLRKTRVRRIEQCSITTNIKDFNKMSVTIR